MTPEQKKVFDQLLDSAYEYKNTLEFILDDPQIKKYYSEGSLKMDLHRVNRRIEKALNVNP